ncbi:Dad4p [Sporobolomyces koalae]|uniref:Dad4p n=1 Tax=Sporobolomyces koalae TaxID=500713 RepID=UPI00316C34DF
MAPPLLNPYEEEQQVVISRILGTVEKLNESMLEANRAIEQVNAYNASTSEIVELWVSYMRNVQWNLQSTQQMQEPM